MFDMVTHMGRGVYFGVQPRHYICTDASRGLSATAEGLQVQLCRVFCALHVLVSVCLCVCMSVCLSVCLCVYVSVWYHVLMSVALSVLLTNCNRHSAFVVVQFSDNVRLRSVTAAVLVCKYAA